MNPNPFRRTEPAQERPRIPMNQCLYCNERRHQSKECQHLTEHIQHGECHSRIQLLHLRRAKTLGAPRIRMFPGESQRLCVHRAQKLCSLSTASVSDVRLGTKTPSLITSDDDGSDVETIYHSKVNSATVVNLRSPYLRSVLKKKAEQEHQMATPKTQRYET